MPSKEKSPWLTRLDDLRSVSFEGIAAELNLKRLRDLREVYSADFDEPGAITRLPADKRASAKRMYSVLIALHSVLGNRRSAQIKLIDIATKMGPNVSLATVRRGLHELAEAHVISLVKRERPRIQGGQSANEYMIVWATIKDMALQQGLQPTLFDDEALDANVSATEEVGRPGELPGRNTSTRAPSQNGRAPSQNGRAPIDRPAGARPLFPLSKSSLLLLRGGEEERNLWEQEIGPRMRDLDIRDVRGTIAVAITIGWSALQAMELINDWQRHCIVRDDGKVVTAWAPGAIWWQLRNGAAGSSIEMPHSTDYRREMVAQQARNRRIAEVEKQAAIAAAPDLEALHGRMLDEMSASEVQALAESLGTIAFRVYRRIGKNGMRRALLIELHRRSTEKVP